MKKFLVVGLVAFASLAAQAQTYMPALNLAAGKKYAISVSTKGSTTQEAMGQKMEMPLESVNYQVLDIKAATGKGYQASSTTSRITFAMSMMGQDMSYDSDKKEDRDGKLGEGLNKQVGVTTSFEVAKDGKIIESTVVKPKTDDESQDMMAGIMSSMGVSEAATPVFNLFSEVKEMKVGDSFTEAKTIDKDGEGKNSTVYTFTSLKDGVATFTFSGTGNLDKKMTVQGMEMMSSTTNTVTGEMTVDVATGLLIKKTFKVETTGKIEVQNNEIPTTSSMVITITVNPA
jgi:Family of unknown function (DUF6263)